MSFWTYNNLATVTNGQWLVEPDDRSAQITGLWHDTREIKSGQAYIAIAGENFDGHDFVDKAFDAGAALAIVQADPKPESRNPNSAILKVDDTVKALQDLARAYRDELTRGGCKVIGIAGSNGKTTTRHLIHHVLTHAGLKGTQSPKSFNNHLGVPLTLLQAGPDDDFVAAEIGTNHPGEIDFLSAIVRPDIAVITSIGEEHLEFFKDLDGVAKEEFAICGHVADGGVLIVGDLDAFNDQRAAYVPDHLQCIACVDSGYEPPADMALPGAHNRVNAVVAVCVAQRFEIQHADADAALLSIRPAAHRGELIHLCSGVTIYDDCYNANPSSMLAALGTLYKQPAKRTVAVMGDMFELGDEARSAHLGIGGCVPTHSESKPHAVVFVGPMMCEFGAARYRKMTGHEPMGCFPEFTDRTPGDVADLLQPGDTVLLKGSRGMALERLIPAIERRFGVAQGDKPT